MIRERQSLSMGLKKRPHSEWMNQASCAQTVVTPGNDPWFTEGVEAKHDQEVARRICNRCPVWRECRADIDQIESSNGALQWGMRAGETPQQRRQRRNSEQEVAA